MKSISVTAALLASALAVAGCNKGAAPANNTAAPKPAENVAAPAPAPAPAANEAAEGEDAGAPTASVATARQNFSVVNRTGHTVLTLNVSPTSEE